MPCFQPHGSVPFGRRRAGAIEEDPCSSLRGGSSDLGDLFGRSRAGSDIVFICLYTFILLVGGFRRIGESRLEVRKR